MDFEATATYSDVPFSSGFKENETAFYNVDLHEPEALACGGNVKRISGISSLLLYREKKQINYDYVEDSAYKEEGCVNIYPKAIEKILYSYFNKDQITHYREKVSLLEEAVDRKFEGDLLRLREEKLALKKELKSGEIDSKMYQKCYTPIRVKKEELERRMFRIKHDCERRYFQCCELNVRYRIFPAQKQHHCDERNDLCTMTPYLTKLF